MNDGTISAASLVVAVAAGAEGNAEELRSEATRVVQPCEVEATDGRAQSASTTRPASVSPVRTGLTEPPVGKSD